MLKCPICGKYICECGEDAVDKESAYVSHGVKSEPLDRPWFISFGYSAEELDEAEQ